MNTLKTFTRYALYTLLCLVFLTSCEDKYPKYRYLIRTTHDNNWTSSAIIRCDSLNMINQTKVILWIDGRKMDLYAPEIRIYDNPYHK